MNIDEFKTTVNKKAYDSKNAKTAFGEYNYPKISEKQAVF